MSRVDRPGVDTIRSALWSERRGLRALTRRASLAWEEQREELLAHPDAFEVPADAVREGRVRVAVGGGRILGLSVTLPVTDEVAELDGLFVEPEHMGRGVGRRLVADVAARARADGVRRLDVTANPRAVGFYERLGFVGDGAVATRFGPALRMRLELPSTVP